MGKVKVCTVSPSMLAGLPPIPKDRKPPKQFLLGLQQPWEPYPWQYDMTIEKMMTSFACSGTAGTGNVNRYDRAPLGPMSQKN